MALEVLLVDDDPSLLGPFETMLRIKGCNVDTAVSCKEGIERYRSDPTRYNLIFTDLNQTPSGVDLIDAVRAINPQVPVYVITGGTTDPHLEQAAIDRLGRDHILKKPFRLQVISNIVENVEKPKISLFYFDTSVLHSYALLLRDAGYEEVHEHLIQEATQPQHISEQVLKDKSGLVFLSAHYTPLAVTAEGLNALKALKSHDVLQYVPVVVISANSTYYQEAILRGACDFLNITDINRLSNVAERYLPKTKHQS